MISPTLGIFHPGHVILGFGILSIGFFLYLRFKFSTKFEKIVKKATEDEFPIETTTVVNNIVDAEEALEEKAERQREKAKDLNKDSDVIDSFLTSRGEDSNKFEKGE